MRALLLAAGVLGLALVFHLSEPAPASTMPVTSDDVQLLSEQMPSHDGLNSAGQFGNNRRPFRIR